ncbi:MAG: PAS domain S-box-containing protein [Cognaticolwellia sp.]|jgi:PAS domain S-box-containing protein
MSFIQKIKQFRQVGDNFNLLNLNLKKALGTEGIFVLVLGFGFVSLCTILSVFVEEVNIPIYWMAGWSILTLICSFLYYKFDSIKGENAQVLLFFFGIGIMGSTVLLKYLNAFSDHFIFFYWTMAVSVSLGISKLRFMVQIWIIPLAFVLFATVFVDIPEVNKLQFYIWNPVITIMSFFGIYSSMKTKNDLSNYRESAKKYQFEFENIMDTMSNTVTIKDDKNNIIQLNKQYAKMYNKQISEFEGQSLYDLLPEKEATRYHHQDLEIISSRKAKIGILEEFHLPDSNKKVWLRSDKFPYYNQEGNVRGVVIFGTDVTKEVDAKMEILRSEAQFEQVFAEAPYGIITLDLSRNIIEANKTFQKMVRYHRKELINKNIQMLITNKINLNDNLDGSQKELSLRTKTGEEFIAQIMFSTVKNRDESLNYTIAIIEDITEKKASEKQLEEYAKALQESNKDLEQFAYIASHDMKEPLRMINSYVTLLGKMYSHKLDERGLEFIEFASDGVKRMDHLIKDLLEYSRIGRTEIRKNLVSFDDILLKVMSSLRYQINEKKVDFDIDVDLPKFLASRTQVFMLFQNLISNGIKYNQSEKPLISISSIIENDIIQFTVKDNGIGMKEKHLGEIFQIFQRLHGREQYEGTGIGLAVCKRIVKYHSGDIWVESEEGIGSSFHFTLPLETEKEAILIQ